MASKRRPSGAGGDHPEFVVKRFGGLANNPARQDIEDEEFFKLQNVMPLSDGNLQTLPGSSVVLADTGENGQPAFVCPFLVGNNAWVFAVWAGSGNARVINISLGTNIFLGAGFIGGIGNPPPITAVPYNNQGILILGANYYDWNVTAPNTLTTWSQTVDGALITSFNAIPASPTGAPITVTNDGITPADGTGASLQVHYGCLSAAVVQGGTGYTIGNILTMVGGSPVDSTNKPSPASAVQVLVTTVSGSGAITGISLSNAGVYAGPATGGAATLPGGGLFTGGTGTGAQFSLSWQVLPNSVQLLAPGKNYAGGELSHDKAQATCTRLLVNTPPPGATITGNFLIPATPTGANITVLNDGLHPNDGAGMQLRCTYKAVGVQIVAAGTGYAVNDVLTITGGTFSTAATFTVIDVSGTGAVLAVAITTAGAYQGPITSGTATLPGGAALTGGAGSGAQLTVVWQVDTTAGVTVVAPGAGYAGGETSNDYTVSTYTTLQLQSTGFIQGSAIAVFANRVWIASGRTIFVTEVNSYNNFGGSGTNFTIQDDYLVGNITALFTANNYLYIFGQSSIDALSNVTIQNGLISFSRINLVTGVGTDSPNSLVGFFRGVMFHHSTGLYMLAGATPERISEKVQGTIRATGQFLWACTFILNAELCIAINVWNLGYLLIYFKQRWFQVVLPSAPPGVNFPIFAIPGGNQSLPALIGVAPLYYFDASMHSRILRAFDTTQPHMAWIASTKLWDAGAPLSEKQAITAAVAALNASSPTSGVTYTIDTELVNTTVLTFPATPTAGSTYALMVDQAQGGASQYIGFTLSGDGLNAQTISLLALRAVVERDMLQ